MPITMPGLNEWTHELMRNDHLEMLHYVFKSPLGPAAVNRVSWFRCMRLDRVDIASMMYHVQPDFLGSLVGPELLQIACDGNQLAMLTWFAKVEGAIKEQLDKVVVRSDWTLDMLALVLSLGKRFDKELFMRDCVRIGNRVHLEWFLKSKLCTDAEIEQVRRSTCSERSPMPPQPPPLPPAFLLARRREHMKRQRIEAVGRLMDQMAPGSVRRRYGGHHQRWGDGYDDESDEAIED